MIEYRPSNLLNNVRQGGSEQYDLSTRTQTIKDLKQSLLRSAKLEQFDDDFADLSTLCELSIKDKNKEAKAHLVDLALCYFDFLKMKMRTYESPQSASQALQDIQKNAMLKMAEDLSELAKQNCEQLMQYEANHMQGDDFSSLIDLLLLSEIVCFSLLAYDTATIGTPSACTDAPSPSAINYSDELLCKFNNLILNEKMHCDNQELAKNMLNRVESGIFQSMEDLIGTVLQTHPDEQMVSQGFLCQAEDIFIKTLTSPLNQHSSTSNAVFLHLLANTVPEYHIQMGKSIIKLVEALYLELKRGGQDPFKKKILFKINYIISLLMLNSDQQTCHEMIKEQARIIMDDGYEMSYLIFTAVDGAIVRKHHNLNDQNQTVGTASKLIEFILGRLETFIMENQDKMEKANSMKTLVLLLKPLEEMIKLCGTTSENLPKKWRQKVFVILKAMGPIFPMQKQIKANPPHSLLESYYQLSILADEGFQRTKNFTFVKFYQLFCVVSNQLYKSESNALVMVKVIGLLKHVEIPAQDKNHFHNHFGITMKKLLMIKEINIFYAVLKTFIEWAKTTELDDLNFMVPDDPTVQNFLQNFMQNSKIDFGTNNSDKESKRMFDFKKMAMENALKDTEIMERFCRPIKKATPIGQAPSADTDDCEEYEVPELARKLVEVELMIRGKQQPEGDLAATLYKGFKKQNWPNQGSDAELRQFISSADF